MNKSKEDTYIRSEGARTHAIVRAGLAKRRAAEMRFRLYGLISIVVGLSFLVILFGNIFSHAWPAFQQTYVALDVKFDEAVLVPDARFDAGTQASADYPALLKRSLYALFPEVTDRQEKRSLYGLLSSGAAHEVQKRLQEKPDLLGKTERIWVPADDDVDMFTKGAMDRNAEEGDRRLADSQLAWLDKLRADGRLEKHFNMTFFTAGDSREPELAGVWGAVMGSFFTLLVTMTLSLPLGIATAVYLEEFAPRNRWTDIIEVNINNLAAVPSIVFGLLGLSVFINFFGLPRSSPMVGGLVLTLMTLPVIIIASRSALKSVPPSIREAALGVGASQMQTVFHHVLPLAMPGMLTGAIIGMARALGESAPLLMIGMVAFIVDIPGSMAEPSTVLPVQIYLWADSSERGFVERTSAAILVLMAFLILMNGLAVYLRKRFERRW
ncbi:MAG: phosphate ABC transporter permease PstA [Methylococcaceae bacterium]|nr:phosphate ABC transporter permease PstA [Methylococcaceae bacterium]